MTFSDGNGEGVGGAELLLELARVKVLFQQRAIVAALGIRPDTDFTATVVIDDQSEAGSWARHIEDVSWMGARP